MQTHPKLPKYWQISQSLREQIASGAYSPGARLPSVAEMQAQHGVSLSTVNQACALLEKDGLIVREQGRGTFVAEREVPRATRTLGLLLRVGMSANRYMMNLLTGVRREAARQGLNLLWLDEEAATPDVSQIDAVLLCCEPSEALAMNLPPQMPHALLFHHSPDFTCVVADDFTGAKLATQHLLDLGHRRIACLCACDVNSISRRRLAGYREALREANLPIEESRIKYFPQQYRSDYRRAGEQVMQDWLEAEWAESGCTALVAHNDETAIGVIKALFAARLRVPEDVSVVGFDGTELSELSTPALTTVRVPLCEIGAVAVQTLVEQIQNGVPSEAQKIVLPVQLKIGASTAPVAIRSQAKVSLHK